MWVKLTLYMCIIALALSLLFTIDRIDVLEANQKRIIFLGGTVNKVRLYDFKEECK